MDSVESTTTSPRAYTEPTNLTVTSALPLELNTKYRLSWTDAINFADWYQLQGNPFNVVFPLDPKNRNDIELARACTEFETLEAREVLVVACFCDEEMFEKARERYGNLSGGYSHYVNTFCIFAPKTAQYWVKSVFTYEVTEKDPALLTPVPE